ncbi:MAG: phosphate starvation-inducible protein PhoH, partial [Bacteroidales bacterium]|nr:phosphate starvation-inducible protein PhoH [Bacteroidales bacterium]
MEGIDPVILYGVNNVRYERIRNAFPKLKLVARGNEIKAMGDKSEVAAFERKVNLLIAFYQKHNNITDRDIDQIIQDDAEIAAQL